MQCHDELNTDGGDDDVIVDEHDDIAADSDSNDFDDEDDNGVFNDLQHSFHMLIKMIVFHNLVYEKHEHFYMWIVICG